MHVAFGLKAHSGWAALVALGREGRGLRVVERCRLELVRPEDSPWAKAPYHAAEGMPREEAHDVVRRAVASARTAAASELRTCAEQAAAQGHEVRACAVLAGAPMPSWSVDQIRAVHFRMHKAEGELFRDALLRGSEACGLPTLPIPEKELAQRAGSALRLTPDEIQRELAALGKSVGPPWGRDQKDAALAAWIALASAALKTRARSTRR
jgi:hypothetical protein